MEKREISETIRNKIISKVSRINKKSILITFEDGTYAKDSIAHLLDYYLQLPNSDYKNNKAIVTFFENREENNISNGLYRLYNEKFQIKSILEQNNSLD